MLKKVSNDCGNVLIAITHKVATQDSGIAAFSRSFLVFAAFEGTNNIIIPLNPQKASRSRSIFQ